jgi:NAD(P)H-dependent FMN reductase
MRILAISGSLQRRSLNTALLRAAHALAPPGIEVQIYDGLGALPHFNPDDERDGASPAVADLRAELAAAGAVLIATPEYAHGAPGVLKNALDWIVGSGELTDKPLALLSAAPGPTGGIWAQMALLPTLTIMGAALVETLSVPLVRQKLGPDGSVADPETARRIAALVRSLARAAGWEEERRAGGQSG